MEELEKPYAEIEFFENQSGGVTLIVFHDDNSCGVNIGEDAASYVTGLISI